MAYFPPPQHIYQPQPQPQPQQQFMPPQPQYVPPMYPPMTPSVPPKPELSAIPQQRYPQAPFQPPIIPQINPTVPIQPPIPVNAAYQPVQNLQPSKIPLPEQFKKPPPQNQPFSLISSNLNQANKERYVWSQKKDPIKWGVAESIDVEQIVRSGDINSLLFYLSQFMNANFTKDDQKKFGCRGALNIFLVFQLGVEYLLKEYNKAKQESEQDNYKEMYIELVNQYNNDIDRYNKAIKEREDQIQKLIDQKEQLNARMRELKNVIEKKTKNRKKSHGIDQTSSIHKHKHHHHHNPPKIDSLESSEPGQVHDQTDIKRFKQDHDSNSSRKNKKYESQDNTAQLDTFQTTYSEGQIHGSVAEEIHSFMEDDDVDFESIDDGEIVQYEEEEEEDDDNY